jgi:serine/threonine-protein kinase ATR
VAALDTSGDVSESISSRCSVTLPSASSISGLWPDSQHLVALPQGLQRTISSRPQAILLGLHLLRMTLDHDRHKSLPKQTPHLTANGNCLPWALDCCDFLWQSYKKWRGCIERGRIHDEIEAAFMHVLASVCLAKNESPTFSPKIVLALSTSLSNLVLSCSADPFSQSNQMLLASLLTKMMAAVVSSEEDNEIPVRRRMNIRSLVTDNITPSILEICSNTLIFFSLQKDLQVCVHKLGGRTCQLLSIPAFIVLVDLTRRVVYRLRSTTKFIAL